MKYGEVHLIPEDDVDAIGDVPKLLEILEKHGLFDPYNMLYLPLLLAIVRNEDHDELISTITKYAKDQLNSRPPLCTFGKLEKSDPGRKVV